MRPHSCGSTVAGSALLILGIPPHGKREVKTTFESIFRMSKRYGESITRCISKTYKILCELSMMEYLRLPQDMTGEKRPGSLHMQTLCKSA